MSRRGLVRIAPVALYLTTVVVLAGAILEAVARSTNRFGYVRSSSPRLVYELRPTYWNHSRAGCRDREYSRPKPEGVFRVIGIGDSCSYGSGVPRGRVFLKVAESELSGRGAQYARRAPAWARRLYAVTGDPKLA